MKATKIQELFNASFIYPEDHETRFYESGAYHAFQDLLLEEGFERLETEPERFPSFAPTRYYKRFTKVFEVSYSGAFLIK